jgi:hypothetical protein
MLLVVWLNGAAHGSRWSMRPSSRSPVGWLVKTHAMNNAIKVSINQSLNKKQSWHHFDHKAPQGVVT